MLFELIFQRTAEQDNLLVVLDEPFAGVTDDFVPFILGRLNEMRKVSFISTLSIGYDIVMQRSWTFSYGVALVLVITMDFHLQIIASRFRTICLGSTRRYHLFGIDRPQKCTHMQHFFT